MNVCFIGAVIMRKAGGCAYAKKDRENHRDA